MKVAIATTQVPFVSGGAEYLAVGLKNALERAGHLAEIITIPFKWYPPESIAEHILASRLVDITETCGDGIDKMIGLKFPAYYFKHPNKVMWVLHQHRTAYDLWGTPYQDIPSTGVGLRIREMIINADNNFLREASSIYTISKNISKRLKAFNNIDSVPLYHPPFNFESYYSDEYGDFVFFPSRIGGLKRQQLAVESMKYVKSNAKLIIAGRPDNKYSMEELKKVVHRNRLDDRVQIVLQMSEEDKLSYYAHCCGVVFVPYDEDYGYITLEAIYAKRPVITCIDSGGPTEFIENNVSGFIAKPEPEDIASAIDKIYFGKKLAAKMGNEGYRRLAEMNLGWENVVRELLK